MDRRSFLATGATVALLPLAEAPAISAVTGRAGSGDARLNQLVRYAHAHYLWIRFYTLDGATKAELSCNGWFSSYNFGSKDAVQKRWEAAAKAGADYIATDQYEVLETLLKARK